MEEALQKLIDEAAIRNLQIRYCKGIDRRDWDLVRSCYHVDATDDHGEFSGNVDDFLEYCQNGIQRFTSTSHLITNQLIEIEGDSAIVEAYVLASHRIPAGEDGQEKDWICNSRFNDLIERRDGEWRITRRQAILDSDHMVPVNESWMPLFQSS